MSPRHVRWTCIALAVAFAAAASAGAQPLSSQTLAIDPSRYFGPRLVLTTTSFLIWTTRDREPGCDVGCASKELLLIQDVDGTPRITSLVVPQASFDDDPTFRPQWTRLSATRVLMRQRGEDGSWGSEDDGLYLLDDLGGSNRISSIPLGPRPCTPVRLDDATAALVLADAPDGYGVEHLLILSDLGRSPSVRSVSASKSDLGYVSPVALSSRSLLIDKNASNDFAFLSLDDPKLELVDFQLPFRRGEPLRLSATSVLLFSIGPSAELVWLLRDLGGTNQWVYLDAPHADRLMTRLSSERALVRSRGPDQAYGTLDDQVLLLDDLRGVPTVTPIPVPRLKDGIAAVALDHDLAVVVTSGGDARSGPEDGVAVLSGLGTHNDVTQVVVGPLSNAPTGLPNLSQPVRLGPRSLALGSLGADGVGSSPDDEVVTLTDVEGVNRVDRRVVGDLWRRTLEALPPAGALVLTEGADGAPETPDDAIVSLSGVGADLDAQSLEVGLVQPLQAWPVDRDWDLLGNGRALLVTTEGWIDYYGPLESRLRVVSGLPGGLLLEADEIALRREPGKGARIRATADLVLPDPELFARSDLTIRVGNASQTIPAERIEKTASGFRYLDAQGDRGWLRRVEYDAAAGRVEVSGRGSGIGAGSTRARNLILSFESLDFEIAQSLDGRVRPSGISYRRP